MKRIFFTYHTGYCGQDGCDAVEVEDDLTENGLNEMAWQQALEHASSYGIELCSDECEDEDCEMEHPGNTGIEGSWEPFDPQLHNPKRPGGGKWFED